MSTTLEKIAAGDVSRILAEQGIPKDKPVTVLVDEDMAQIARRACVRANARWAMRDPRGLPEVFSRRFGLTGHPLTMATYSMNGDLIFGYVLSNTHASRRQASDRL